MIITPEFYNQVVPQIFINITKLSEGKQAVYWNNTPASANAVLYGTLNKRNNAYGLNPEDGQLGDVLIHARQQHELNGVSTPNQIKTLTQAYTFLLADLCDRFSNIEDGKNWMAANFVGPKDDFRTIIGGWAQQNESIFLNIDRGHILPTLAPQLFE